MRITSASLLAAFVAGLFSFTHAIAGVLELDGNGDFVTFPATGIPSGSAPFTIECWINPTTIPTGGQNGGQMTFWGNESANQANGFRLRGTTGTRHFFWANDHDENLSQDVLPETSGPVSNGWHHFAITWDGTQTRWYWNGQPLGNPRTAMGVNVVAANHRIGARPGGEFFHGYMDEIRVWSVARSAADILAMHRQELNGDESGLVAYWNFEGNMNDKAGGNNNGSPQGNAVVNGVLNAPVAPVGPRVYSFNGAPNPIYLGQSTTLSWAVSNALSVVIEPGVGAVSPSNSVAVSPTNTTTYTLTATNLNGVRAVDFTVTVDPGIPLAQNFATNTSYNTPVAITLRATDPQGSNLTYAIVTPPAHGNVSGTPPNITYTPNVNFGGPDTFTFKANDGQFDSAPATVSVNVIPPPLPPSSIILSSTNISSSAAPGAFIASLQAIDVNNFYGDTQTFALVPGGPDNAQFIVTGNQLTASPLFAGGPGATFSIRLRATDSTSLSYTQDVALRVFDAPRSVVINEFHYNPEYNPSRESFIELYNDTDQTVDISNWRIRGGVDFYFPANTFLSPRQFIVVSEDPATVQSRFGVNSFGPWSGGLNNEGENLTLRDALSDVVDRVEYKSEFPWPVAANGNGPSAQLVNPLLDNDLGSSWRSALPTPGATNSVFAANAAPNIRQVNHSPNWPSSTNQVTITAKVTDPDGVASVTLAYQVVTPGNFIPATLPLTGTQLNSLNSTPITNALNPAFEAATNWTTVTMHDDGANGDEIAGDGVYSVLLPQQANRVLVRYRITCTDLLGASRRAPFEDDPSLNFAYFVYDGVPNYLGFTSASLQTLPVYFLITRDVDMNQCAAWYSPFNNGTDQLPQTVNGSRNQGRLHFNWEGAFVYDGKVFDHVKYRLRGANGRYFAGKRSFRIKFNDGALFQAYDNNGKKFPTKWREVVTGKGQSNRGGEQFALNEVVNYFLWNKVGVPAPRTLYFHFRVIRGASEAGANQYSGDFWGLNWAQEKYDAAFLDSHDLPKGNLYKLVDNFVEFTDEQRYQAPFAPTNGADFYNIENNLDGFKSTDWLNAHANYTNWYRYFAIARGIRHYDTWPSANKNGAWYFEPLYGASNSFLGRVMQLPYDGTDTWGPTWNNGDDVLYNGIFATGAAGGDSGFNPAMQLEYRNVVREIRALLFQPDQMNAIIDAFANLALPVATADLQRWLNAPAPANYGSLTYNSNPAITGGILGYAQDMKNFMFTGGNNAWWIDRTSVAAGGWVTVLDSEAADTAIPTRPTITYIGSNGFPASGLTFQSSPFADPQGAGTFGAIQWRVAQIVPTNMVLTNPAQLRLEWDAAWTSPEITTFNSTLTFPEYAVEAGKTYRARVRHKDNTGRWSEWSAPIAFVPSPTDTVSALRTNLVFNEIMYNPPAFGGIDGDELEYVELKNVGSFALNLSGLFFSAGITYVFPDGTSLAPGAVYLIARNNVTLPVRYPGVVIHGVYTDKLNNDGETLTIRHPAAGDIVSITYDDRTPWPASPDGFGFSLVRAADGTYRASADVFGNPGVDGGASAVGGVVINELLSNSTLPLKDFIELQNVSTTNVDVSGWFLSDDPALPQKFRIPNRAPLAPGEFVVFTEDDFNPNPSLGTSFSLSSFGEELYLFSAQTNGVLTGYDTGVAFGAAADGESFGRHINSAGDVQFPAQITLSPNATNAGPRVGPVVISEIHYHPDFSGFEFVELQNISGAPVAMFNSLSPTNTWRLNGAGFTFPTNITLQANEIVIVTATNPADFRARYGVPANIPVFGPFGGNLQDSGEQLELQRPETPTSNGIPWVTIDAVRYNDKTPWPEAADGAGPSLQRKLVTAYGNEPTNWVAAAPGPGSTFTPGNPPVITNFPSNVLLGAGSTLSLFVGATGDAILNYRWLLAGTNIPGATNATLTLSNAQVNSSGVYQAVVFNSAGAAQSSNFNVSILAPAYFTLQPTNQNVLPGTNVTLTAAAAGIGAIRYQWRFEGVDIPGATNASYSFTNANLTNHHGNFSCVIQDDISTAVSSNAFIYVLVRPGIVQHLRDVYTLQGGTTIFSLVATGAPPLGYRWLSNGVTIAATAVPSLTISNVQFTFRIRAVVTNLALTAGVLSPGPTAGTSVTNYVLADFDGDGMADSWEAAYFGNTSTNTSANALADTDGDKMTNRDEYLAGTNPTNALSLLNILFSATNAQQLEFVAQSNVSYSVQWRTNLSGPGWTNLTSILASPQVRTISVEAATAPGNGERYFRIVTPLVP